jgi:hypothetical protein|tara:strand:- start:1619 stop:2029 length:411 start_codon:yes stop_codon:yes gene_type:complete
MAEVGFTYKQTGPLFDKDMPKNLIEAVNSGILELATIEGSNEVKDQLYEGHGFITGNLKNHIGADLVDDLVAQVDAGRNRYGGNLVYAAWIEGIGKRNPRSRFKGYHMFENARKRIEGNQSMFDKYVGRAIERAFE